MNLNEARREAKSQLCVFRENLLIHSTVVLKHEGIVWIGDEKHVVNAVEHQVNKGGIFQRHSRSGRFIAPKLRIISDTAKHLAWRMFKHGVVKSQT